MLASVDRGTQKEKMVRVFSVDDSRRTLSLKGSFRGFMAPLFYLDTIYANGLGMPLVFSVTPYIRPGSLL